LGVAGQGKGRPASAVGRRENKGKEEKRYTLRSSKVKQWTKVPAVMRRTLSKGEVHRLAGRLLSLRGGPHRPNLND